MDKRTEQKLQAIRDHITRVELGTVQGHACLACVRASTGDDEIKHWSDCYGVEMEQTIGENPM